jgi:serine/threonine-protein kinase
MNSSSMPIAGRELRVLGRHRIIAKLGQGGMADVYLTVVQGHGVNKLFVAKVLRDDLGLDEHFRAMFVKEARIATLLHHRNLVQTFEVDVADGQHYISMEYLDGRPLHQIIAAVGRDDMVLDVHVAILEHALLGLHAAHEQKDLAGQELDLVHRDVSPHNVLVTYDGEVKVVDFGVAKVRGVGGMTETGALIGKIGYMAPEQALSGAIDRRADVFAVGIMLWEAIARRPFVDREDGEAAALRKRLNGEIPSPRAVAPSAPEELIAICERAIAYEASDRFATAAEFAEALRAYLEAKGARVGAKEISAVVAPPFEKDRAQVRQMIEERLAGLDRAADETPTLAGAPSGSVVRRRESGLARFAVPAIGVVAVVGLVATLAVRGSSQPAPPLPAVASVAAATPPAPSPSSVADPPKKSVRVRFRIAPSSAQLALDGKALPTNPYVGELPADAAMHVLTANADGYTGVTHDVHLDSDVDVDLTLAPAPQAPVRPPTAQRPRVVAGPARPALRPVDDKDPYAQ